MSTSHLPLDRIAILGCGKIALHHAAALARAGATIVAGSTRRPDSLRWHAFHTAFPNVPHVADGAALLADSSIDGIVVSLPWHEIPHWLPSLLACPKPMLIEKPIALVAAVLDDALRNGASTAAKMVGFNRRFYEGVGRVRDRLAMGGLKAVYATISEDVGLHVERHGTDIVPHLLAYGSSHSLDLLLHLLGPLKVERMYRFAERRYASPFVCFNGVLENELGCPIFLALNAEDPVHAGLRFLFDDHTSWVLAPLECLRVFHRYDVAPEAECVAIRRYEPRQLESIEEDLRFKPGFVAQARAFISGQPGHGAAPEDFGRVLHLIEALRSHRGTG